MNSIDYYYKKFIGIKSTENEICCSENRNDIINDEFIYPIVFSKYNNRKYFSIMPKLYDKFVYYIKDKDLWNMQDNDVITLINTFFLNNYKNEFEIKKMYRMYNNSIKYENSNALKLNYKTKEYFMNTGKKAIDREYKEKKWLEFSKKLCSEYSYFIPYENKMVSLAYISNICFNGANIVVSTDKEYRNMGYGKAVVSSLCNYVRENNIYPIYWVNVENYPSINLARSLEFKTFAEEIVVRVKLKKD